MHGRAPLRGDVGVTALARDVLLDKLLTTPNPGPDEDTALIRDAGLAPMAPA